MAKSKYLISTVTGQIPNIVLHTDTDSLKEDLMLYLDDFLFKDSYYDTDQCELSLREFCTIEEGRSIFLGFRNTPKILISKRGNFKLTKERYQEILKVMKPDYYIEYTTKDVLRFLDNSKYDKKYFEPKDLNEFIEYSKVESCLVGTNFLNELIKNKQMISYEDFDVRDIFDCECCGKLEKGYLEYLLSINEINGFIYLTVHNFNVIAKICSSEVIQN